IVLSRHFLNSCQQLSCVLANGRREIKQPIIKRFSLSRASTVTTAITPEQMTIEIALYFCRLDFVGHFICTAGHWRHTSCIRCSEWNEVSRLEQYRTEPNRPHRNRCG